MDRQPAGQRHAHRDRGARVANRLAAVSVGSRTWTIEEKYLNRLEESAQRLAGYRPASHAGRPDAANLRPAGGGIPGFHHAVPFRARTAARWMLRHSRRHAGARSGHRLGRDVPPPGAGQLRRRQHRSRPFPEHGRAHAAGRPAQIPLGPRALPGRGCAPHALPRRDLRRDLLLLPAGTAFGWTISL